MAKEKNRSGLSKKNTRGRKRSSKHPKAISVHHILPRSRGGGDGLENKAKIVACDHEKFHKLFKNMTPFETLAWLQIYFWGLQIDYVSEYCFNRDKFLFNNGRYNLSKRSRDKSQRVTLRFHKAPFIRYVFHEPTVIPYHSEIYYELFGSMTQYEILAWLEVYFWKKQTRWINEYVSNKDYFLSNLD
ncbi:hypothetical protein CVU82_00755 [Candidatus Falkowbacteria bacterium HGW-Falkowbacteria-1]|jgi:hypothetical protein|uniref:Uncharacterized protein n=1 Tax=Candidatus Falkowbacteria bacterium HGW-Falkowbacteria-1 TaxID=2013768 RepID=A0A2N2EAM3_9BACT|nr:MAG: hypothetical protein CVU82_00755 [Candidatus Falkowbacteria bacterium HGW-Falkowbacteria-1]